jgi:hypothetical protein
MHDAIRQYLLQRPWVSEAQRSAARRVASRMAEDLTAGLVPTPAAPTWLILCELAELMPIVFHGTSEANIECFEPRECVDTNPFGAQRAVYATKDPVWALFYAALDRNPPFSLHNGSFRTYDAEGRRSEPMYFFSIARPALQRRAFSPGYLYLLPAESLVQEPISTRIGIRIEVDHWASLAPVRPLVRISTVAEDFPFLDQIRGHDDATLWKRMEDDPDRFPWVDEQYL